MEEERERVVARLREVQSYASLVGQSPCFLQAVRHVPSAAKSDVTLLVSGETGTGKELVARAVHYLSPRAGRPFVDLNCGALPDSLLEDELFGHDPGAFTDARGPRRGLIEQAEGGTLFLDEVDGLTSRGQVVLLRVLQDKTFRRLGSSQQNRADVRFIAATNAALEELVRARAFRSDLYYRLAVLLVQLPALRQRPEDILLLASHFLEKHRVPDRPVPRLSDDARVALLSYVWPGNVRELENAIVRAIQLGGSDEIGPAQLGIPTIVPAQAEPAAAPPLSYASSLAARKRQLIASFERDYLTQLMREHAGNVTRAARTAGKDRRDLGKLLKKHHLDPKVFSAAS
jgi:transcriptional regulator with GAF, ATPase, and Fis domain